MATLGAIASIREEDQDALVPVAGGQAIDNSGIGSQDGMSTGNRTFHQSCRNALREGLIQSFPDCVLDDQGYVGDAVYNLIEGVHLSAFEEDLNQGSGNELKGKFRAAHSSSALAVNTFAPFKADLPALRLLGSANFSSLQFERKCPHGLPRATPPNLDVVAEGAHSVIAIESKCLEPLSSHHAKFSPAYDVHIRDERRSSSWFAEMNRLVDEPRAYCWLDAAQLIKHAFGLAHTFRDRPVTLLYLFWEPANSRAHTVFQEHRTEVARFEQAVAGSGPGFAAMSYPELWSQWEARSDAPWLLDHIRRLRARYHMPV